MLAVLLQSGRRVGFEALVHEIWPGDPPASAIANLRTYATRLRRLLPPERVLAAGNAFELRFDPDELDVASFDRLCSAGRAALARGDAVRAAAELAKARELWRGAPFDTVPLGPVLTARREVLLSEHLGCLEQLWQARLMLGDHEAMVPELRGHIATHPLREHPHELLMRALCEMGDTTGALALYAALRAHLAEELGVEPGREISELHGAILRREPIRASPALALAARPRGPWQVPASVADFVGRDGEIAELRTAFTNAPTDTCLTFGIVGMAGVGKTTLATRVTEELRGSFPDGCLFADLHGYDPTPAAARDVLGSFIRAMGIPSESLPGDVEERSALWRSLTAGRRVLVVLDNAGSEQQVRPLLPGAGGAVLVTSRPVLAGLAGARTVSLGPLATDDGLRLLERIAGRHVVIDQHAAAQSLVEICGGLPLAVRIIGTRLALRPGRSAAELCDRLADLDVRATLEVSYRRLSPESAAMLDALSALAVPDFTAASAAAAMGVPYDVAERLLDSLSSAQLLNPPRDGRYGTHDLVRLFARERATELAEDAAVRCYDELLVTALYANQRLPCRPMPLPDPARELVRLGRPDLCGSLAVSMVNFCMLRGYLDEWQYGHEQAVLCRATNPERCQDRTVDARLALNLGNLDRWHDRNRAALPRLRRAYRQFRAEGAELDAASAALSWAVTAGLVGRYRVARAGLRVARTLVQGAAPGSTVAGYVLLAHRRPLIQAGDEIEYVTRAMAVLDEAGDLWGGAEARTMLGALRARGGDLAGAVEPLTVAVRDYTSLGATLDAIVAELQLADVYLKLGNHRDARALVARALPAARMVRHRWSEVMGTALSGHLYLDEGRPDLAVAELSQAVAMAREIAQPAILGRTLALLARADLALGDRVGARRLGREAAEILAETDPGAQREITEWLGGVESAGGASLS